MWVSNSPKRSVTCWWNQIPDLRVRIHSLRSEFLCRGTFLYPFALLNLNVFICSKIGIGLYYIFYMLLNSLIFGVLFILYFVLWHLFIVVECFLVEKQSVRDTSGYALKLWQLWGPSRSAAPQGMQLVALGVLSSKIIFVWMLVFLF